MCRLAYADFFTERLQGGKDLDKNRRVVWTATLAVQSSFLSYVLHTHSVLLPKRGSQAHVPVEIAGVSELVSRRIRASPLLRS